MLDNVCSIWLPRLILQLIVIVLATRALGSVAHRLGQPAVIGEIPLEVLLGSSPLWLAADARRKQFSVSNESMPVLQLLSQIGVLLFMFIVGAELSHPIFTRASPNGTCRQPLQHHHSVLRSALRCHRALSRVRPAGRAVSCLCAVLRNRDEHHSFPVLARILKNAT